MPVKERHETQAKHNQRVLATLPADALDWRITLMMYVSLHAIRAHISEKRPGYAGADLNYESIPQILQKEIQPPLPEVALAFIGLKKLCHKARYACVDDVWLQQNFSNAQRAYEDILARLKAVGVEIEL